MNILPSVTTALAATLLLASCATGNMATAPKMNPNPPATVSGELKNYPMAKAGYQRMVIYLPEKTRDQEGAYKVELIPGKMAKVDCNYHSLSGNLEKKELQGFGYDYYEFTSDGNMAATKMACPDTKMTDKFVYGQTAMLDYNSRLPVVVYVPNGFQLKYRVWSASALGDVM